MPYIAYELDALNAAPDLARAAGISEDAAVAGLARMWARCFRVKSDQMTAVELAGVFGADPARLAPALAGFGFVEPRDGGFRVRGTERYLRLSASNSAGGRARAAGAQRDQRGRLMPQRPPSGPPAPQVQRSSPPTEHRAPNTEEKNLPPVGGLRDGWDAIFLEIRHATYVWSFADERAVEKLLAAGDLTEILRRARICLEHAYPTWSTVAKLAEKWNDCAAAQAAGPPKDVRKGVVNGEQADWEASAAVPPDERPF